MSSDVAVVIAAFNAAGTLDEALASVAAQTVPPAEVVVADDCSTDDTAGVAAAWSSRLPLRVVRTETNGGPAVARHAAIAASGSPLIAVLDADDAWLPEHVATMVALHAPDALVTADPTNWLPGHALGGRWSDTHPFPRADPLLALLRENFVFSGTLFERALYERAGGFRASLRVGEDWDLWIRMVRAGAAIARPEQSTVLYRVGTGTMTGDERAGDDRVAVLQLALAGSRSAPERRATASGLRRVRAERSLFAAYRAMAGGHGLSARWHGLAALRGHHRVAVRGLAMAVAPRTTAARRTAARADEAVRLSE